MADTDDKNVEKAIETKEDFVVIREKIKARPIDKRKLFANSLFTILSAIMFGLIACVTFVFLAPVLTNRFTPEEETETLTSIAPVIFPEETIDEEMSPEDMLVTQEEIETTEINLEELQLLEEQQIKEILSSITFTVSDYQYLYKKLSEIAQAADPSLVRLTSVTQDTDWLNDFYEGMSETTGVIVAKTESNLYIVANYNDIINAKPLFVKFSNGIRVIGEIGRIDSETGLCTVVIPLENINNVTLEYIKVANLGSSFSPSVVGTPIIAVGSPMGTFGSICYGMVTGNSTKLSVVDNMYKLVTTDMYGNSNATGVIISLRGDVLGIISNKFSKPENGNLILAIGITELKKTIENLINETDIAYLGIKGSDVPEEAILSASAPMGAYVTNVSFDSPAMVSGIQSGDIISGIGNISISKFSELITQLRIMHPGTEAEFKIYRPVQGEYKEISIHVVLGTPKGR